jgi:hypothetical protein
MQVRMRPESALSKLRSLVPDKIAGAVANCGGTNWRRGRFAGNIVRSDLTSDEYVAICHSLIFPNGVRKTTSPTRNTQVMRKLLELGYLVRKPSIRVLEVGASAGLDALATWELLRERGTVERYDLGDLFTELHYDEERGLIFDQDGHLLQVDLGSRFVAIYFAYNYWFQRFTNLPKRVHPWLLQRRLRHDPVARKIVIPLVHSKLGLGSTDTPFRSKRMDVFEPIDERYDLVICMHLLVERYFDRSTIARGTQNLAAALAPGGTLIVGATERFDVITRAENGTFETRRSSELRP